MKKLKIKKDRFTCDIWKVISSKRYKQLKVNNSIFSGYLSLIYIDEVTEPQRWNFEGKSLTVCDNDEIPGEFL